MYPPAFMAANAMRNTGSARDTPCSFYRPRPSGDSSPKKKKKDAGLPLKRQLMAFELAARELVGGCGEGEVMHADIGLSFWGGVCPILGTVIDHTHPLHKQCITGKVLAIPNGRGSCTGSQVMLELILNGTAPAAFVLRQPDVILALGIIIAEEIFGKSIPMVCLGPEGFDKIASAKYASVVGTSVCGGDSAEQVSSITASPPKFSSPDDLLAAATLTLTDEEQSMMSGGDGHTKAMQVAMRTIARAAAIDEAPRLLEVTQAHIDGCTYIGPGGLRFAESLVELGGTVAVPTTLNSNSVDRRRWREMGVPEDLGVPAYALGEVSGRQVQPVQPVQPVQTVQTVF
jgi:predicted aconitase with swiveling domain